MTQVQLAMQLNQLIQAGPNIFLKLNPEIIDFTHKVEFNLIFLAKSFELQIEIDEINYIEILTLVKTALFEENDLFIIGWNIKNLFTYLLAKTGSDFVITNKLLDLKLAESFIGIRERSPSTFSEVLNRLKLIFQDSSWDKFKNIYQNIYYPLMTAVIPRIEAEGVFHTEKRKILFPYYEIEGQVGGRLSCQLAYEQCFNPHSLSEEERTKLYPKANGFKFLYFDYQFHEVCVLAWLTKDETLRDLTEEGDFYKKLYTLVTGNPCDSEVKRSFCKNYLFLPTIYGQSISTLAERAKVDISIADKLVKRLHNLLPSTFAWLNNYELVNGVCTDYVGRKRHFVENEEYKYRNFIIQSPGAIFTLEKLVALHKAIKDYGAIVAHIYDGFVVRCDNKQTEMTQSVCLKALESESDILPGLKLKVNCKISNSLA